MALNIENIDLKDIYSFIENGNPDDAPEAVVQYLGLLEKVRAMFMRIDKFGSKEAIVKHLIVADGFSRYKASQIADEAQEYFYCQRNISKDAWRNIYAEKMDMMINVAMQHIKDVNDASKVVKMLVDVANHRQVNVKDDEKIDDKFFDKPVNLLTYDARIIEFGETNRPALDKFIESLPELTVKEKTRIKQEALLLPLKLFPDEQENPRK
jgi:CRISPR/Cas system CSM-associated protein Csm2 small subunit